MNSIVILTKNNYSPLYDNSYRSPSEKRSCDFKSHLPPLKIMKKSRSSAKDEDLILHKCFYEMEVICNDPYWKSILYNFCRGKFRKGIQFKNGNLNYKIKNKIISTEIDINDPEKGLNDFISFMNKKAGIYSPEDMKKKNLELKEKIEKLSSVEITSWSQVKRDLLKTKLVEDYVEKFNEELLKDGENEMTQEEKNDMKSKIGLGLNSGVFNSENIIFKNNEIHRIDGLTRLENGMYEINFKKYPLKSKKNRSNKKEDEEEIGTVLSCTTKMNGVSVSNKGKTPDFVKMWIKVLKGINKRNSKYKPKS